MACCRKKQTKKLPEINRLEENMTKELMDNFRGERYGYVQVGPKKWIYPVKYEKYAQRYLDFEIRDDDIWIMGFPRSGTSITTELARCLFYDIADRKEIEKSSVAFLEWGMITNDKIIEEKGKDHPDSMVVEFIPKYDQILDRWEKMECKRIIKSHLPFELLPDDLLKKNCKIIYICRNPRDVVNSFYHLQKTLWNIDFVGDFQKYWEYFKNGYICWGPYFEHIKQAYELKNHKNVLFVYYEDFRKDVDKFIVKIAEFLEKPLSESEMEKLKQHLDINNYKKVSKDKYKIPDGLVRKGKVGDWKELFTPEITAEADAWIKSNCEEIGFSFVDME